MGFFSDMIKGIIQEELESMAKNELSSLHGEVNADKTKLDNTSKEKTETEKTETEKTETEKMETEKTEVLDIKEFRKALKDELKEMQAKLVNSEPSVKTESLTAEVALANLLGFNEREVK